MWHTYSTRTLTGSIILKYILYKSLLIAGQKKEHVCISEEWHESYLSETECLLE